MGVFFRFGVRVAPYVPPGDNSDTRRDQDASLVSTITRDSNRQSLSSHVRRCANHRHYTTGVRRKHRLNGVASDRRRPIACHVMQRMDSTESEDEITHNQPSGAVELTNRRRSDIRDRKTRNIRDEMNQFHCAGFLNKTHRGASYTLNRPCRGTRNILKLARRMCVRESASGHSWTADNVADGDLTTLSSWRKVDVGTRIPPEDHTGPKWLSSEQGETVCHSWDSQENVSNLGRNELSEEVVPGTGELTLVLERAYPCLYMGADGMDWDSRSSISV